MYNRIFSGLPNENEKEEYMKEKFLDSLDKHILSTSRSFCTMRVSAKMVGNSLSRLSKDKINEYLDT